LRYPFGDVAVALAAGTVTFDHARTLVHAANPRVIDQLADLQVTLIERAADRPFAVWRSELLALVELLDADGPFDPDRELARNRLHLSEPAPGEVLLSGMLVGEHALVFTEAVRTEADRLWRRLVADHVECPELAMPARATIDALAMIDVIRRGLTADPTTSRAPVTDITLVIHTDDQHFTWTTPNGHTLHSQRHHGKPPDP
jgi:hypothetical protein